jgi:twitching motility two-component system response regulator PilH
MAPAATQGVLVVDDLDDTRELLAEFLMHAGYHSIMASSGVEALKRLDQIRADAIITDLMMPVMGGAELVRHIRADPRLSAIPIIVLTGSGRQKALEELGDAARHVHAVLVKPVKLSELQRALEAALAES